MISLPELDRLAAIAQVKDPVRGLYPNVAFLAAASPATVRALLRCLRHLYDAAQESGVRDAILKDNGLTLSPLEPPR